MRWRRIDKSKAVQPTSGSYADWKPALAEEAAHQCVYCCILEAHFGGQRNFHVEHYRPKSRRPDLRDVYSNLFFACAICNVLKGDDWPAEPGKGFDYPHYPDPSLTDYAEFLTADVKTAEVSGSNVAARYLIARLHLNRPQILRNRKLQLLSEELMKLHTALKEAMADDENKDDFQQLGLLLAGIAELFYGMWKAIPYEAGETRHA